MLARILFAVIALHALTAFAPAPLPRKARQGADRLTVERLSGVWVVLRVEKSSGKGYVPTGDTLREVRIQGGTWAFMNQANGGAGRTEPMTVDGTKSPAWFDLGTKESRGTSGLIRVQNGEMQVLYQWGQPRATSFEAPPDGYWLITFKRK